MLPKNGIASWAKLILGRALRPGTVVRIGGTIVLGQIAVALIGIVSIRLITELAPPSVFGNANLILTVLTLATALFIAPITNTQLRYYTKPSESGRPDGFAGETLFFVLIATVLVSAIAVSGYGIWCLIRGAKFEYVLLTWGISLFCVTNARNVVVNRLHAMRRFTLYSWVLVAEALLIAMATATALSVAATTSAYIAGQAIGGIILFCLAIWIAPLPLFRSKASLLERSDFAKRIWTYGAPFAPLGILTWFANLSDRYVVAYLLGAAFVGQYVAAFAIGSRGMGLTNSALNSFFRPQLFDAENHGNNAAAQKIFWRWIVSGILVNALTLVFLAAVSHFIIDHLLAPAYRIRATPIVLWTAGAYAIYGLTQVCETRLMSIDHSIQLILPVIVGAVGDLGLSFLLVSTNGVVGAAQAACGSFALQFLATGFVLAYAGRARRLKHRRTSPYA